MGSTGFSIPYVTNSREGPRASIQVRAAANTGPAAEAMARRFADEIGALTGAGAEVRVLTPDSASLGAMGANLMDFRQRAAAARAGLDQGAAEAEALRAFWR